MAPPVPPLPPWRIAVVNRGEAAMRLINAVRELRHETGTDIRAIALHTVAEGSAMFVREADEAVALESDLPSPYLDLVALERALVTARADAAWVGWGFVAERAEFAELCDRLGVVFIGPRPEVMRRLGDKIGAKRLAEEAGVPVAAWSGGAVETVEDAKRHAGQIGYPLMVKASAGGGGRGIRRVDRDDELPAAFESARSEAAKAFGDPTVFMERVVSDARHVEVQLIGDDHGTVWALGVRDCSVQRRNQKVLEESQCVAISDRQDADLRAAATRLGRLAGYTNAGTAEFLYQPDTAEFAFLEVNTRLQVEHPVTELTTGVDLVKLQIRVAAGARLEGDVPPATAGFAIEARLNAEDPDRGFAPAPGRLETLTFAVGSGVRVDTGVAEGDVIPPEYDSMIAKVIGYGRTRPEALARLRRALEQTVALIDGGTTNKSFLMFLLDRPEVRDSTVDTNWLDRLTADGSHTTPSKADLALVAAAIDVVEELRGDERDRFLSLARRGRPAVDAGVGREVELRHGASSYRLQVRELGRGEYAVRLGSCEVRARSERLSRARSRLTVGPASATVVAPDTEGRRDLLVDVDGVVHRFSRDEAGVVRAPAAALVVGVDVRPGQAVTVGDRVAVVEAMKMEIGISAPVPGVVTEVFVTRNTQVDAGAPLVRIEPASDGEDPTGDASPITLDAIAGAGPLGAHETASGNGDDAVLLRSFMAGFDVGDAEARAAAAAIATDPTHDRATGPLTVFADLCSLTPERRVPGAGDDASSPREWFNAYLRSLDAEREGLPGWFVERLGRALTHYGVESLDPTDKLGTALMRIAIAHQREGDQMGVVLALLDGLIAGDPAPTPELRDCLDRLIESTQRRYPAIASLARGVRYRAFDRPVIEEHRDAVAAEVRDLVAQLLDPTTGDDRRAACMDDLVSSTLPLMGVLTEHNRFATTPDPAPLLEVLTRRYYKIRAVDDLRTVRVQNGGVPIAVVRGQYAHRERVVKLFAARADGDSAPRVLEVLAELAADVAVPDTAVIDLFITLGADDARTPDDLSSHVSALLDRAGLPALVRRVAAIVSRPEGADTVQLSFRRAGDGGVRPYWMLDEVGNEENGRPDRFREDVKFRGLHPMIARRLQMWRLANFDITRLPSADDVYAFGCVARENPADERLVAVAEVRDLTPVLDDAGRVVALPGVEHVLVGCLDAIRQALARRGPGRTLEWNRVLLHVWPVVDFDLEQVYEIVRRLAPLTDGLGIEQVIVSARLSGAAFGTPGAPPREVALRLGYEPGKGLTSRLTDPPATPMQPLDDYTRKRIQARRRGLVHPYDLAPMLAGQGGTFVEHDLDDSGSLVALDREPGANEAGVVVGVVTSPCPGHPDGVTRVAILGDPTKAMGAITEAECRRILAAIDLAEAMDVPIEWFALSAGAKIAMDSGSENLDWVARVLRRLVEHTQDGGLGRGRDGRRAGGEVNVVVAGINVGAQPYWNAEATMLMHTAGILVMTPDSAMVLTGKQAIDYSGGVSAEDNLGIGGYARIMGPNGEAQYYAPTIGSACELLHDHYSLTYRPPHERWVPRVDTIDDADRDVSRSPHRADGTDFTTIGDIFSAAMNRDRKKPFAIRALMHALLDADQRFQERWAEMAEAEMAVVYDARLGGHAVTLIGIESRPVPRHGTTPADGPAQWSAGTLFPLSSKKVARAINAASGRRPVVVLANLSGFDGSPESLRRLQLEYGAEIGRAIVNFDGPIVLCVVSRYHGGAFVVFSATLNDDMEVLAIEGSFASVIGGAPAAAVVFTRDVDARTRADPRVRALEDQVAAASDEEANVRRAELAKVLDQVRTEKLGEVAAEFDAIHSVERAQRVGSVHRIIAPSRMRPELIDAIERGMTKVDARRNRHA